MRRWLVLAGLAGCSFQGNGGDVAPDAATPIVDGPDARPDGVPGDWWNPAWQYRRRITIDNTLTMQRLVDFPALVTLPTSFDYANALPDLADVRFVSGNGVVVPHELDTFAAAGISTLWVTQTVEERAQPQPALWMYYGNSSAGTTFGSAVWGGDVSVHHLGDLRDSTGLGHLGTTPNVGATPTKIGGKIGEARSFDGSNDAIVLTGEQAYDFTTVMSASAWVNVTSFTKDWQAIVCKGDSSWRLHRGGGGPRIAFSTSLGAGEDNLDTIADVTLGVWHHLAVVYAGSTKTVYLDGVVSTSTFTGPIKMNNFVVAIGENSEATNRFFAGIIDEVRISKLARSSEWVDAEYRVVTDPTFVVLGEPEPRP